MRTLVHCLNLGTCANSNYGKSVYHTGGDRGYITCIERNIDHDKTIIILENHDQGVFPVDIINRNLYNIAFPNEAKLSQQQLDALSGTYEIQKGFDVLPLFAESEFLLFEKL